MNELQHISTYVLLYHGLLFLLGLCNVVKSSTLGCLFSKTVMLHINIIIVMFVVPQCVINNKFYIVAFKLFILLLCYIPLKDHIKMSLPNTLPSILILLVYVLSVNYDKAYDCDIELTQIVYSILLSFITYIILMYIKNLECKKKEKNLEDNNTTNISTKH